ncbi:MAG TPA: DUF2062 domain-containing protein [Acidiferrobacteraceae bacterium]|nr:DUF2062 domain-containing protein [Acidiferrobacteraceae bacterium]
MTKRFIKKYMPDQDRIRNHGHLSWLGKHLHSANLWHLNRRSVSNAFGVGLFCAFLPIPFEMVAAAMGAIAFRANLPISVALVWTSNPFTWVPIFGSSYLLGAHILGLPPVSLDNISLHWLLEQLAPLWLGSLLVGASVALTSAVLVRLLWRINVQRMWARRSKRGGAG